MKFSSDISVQKTIFSFQLLLEMIFFVLSDHFTKKITGNRENWIEIVPEIDFLSNYIYFLKNEVHSK